MICLIGITDLQPRIDTGAKISSLHVDNLQQFKKNEKLWIKFDIHPSVHNVESVIECEAQLHDLRNVKSSNGEPQERYMIKALM